MKKTVLRSLVILFIVTNVCTAQSILDRYIIAIGGKERIDSVKTAILKAEMVSSLTGSASSITALKKEYNFRISLSYENGRGSIHCYDGIKNTGTNKATIAMVEELHKKPKKFAVFNEVIFIPKSELKDEPDETINGIKCNVVSYNDAEWNEFHKYYFDKETHLLVAEDASGYPAFYENYQPTGGILFPMRIKQTIDEIESVKVFTEIILNPDLPDDIFECDSE